MIFPFLPFFPEFFRQNIPIKKAKSVSKKMKTYPTMPSNYALPDRRPLLSLAPNKIAMPYFPAIDYVAFKQKQKSVPKPKQRSYPPHGSKKKGYPPTVVGSVPFVQKPTRVIISSFPPISMTSTQYESLKSKIKRVK